MRAPWLYTRLASGDLDSSLVAEFSRQESICLLSQCIVRAPGHLVSKLVHGMLLFCLVEVGGSFWHQGVMRLFDGTPGWGQGIG